MTLLVTNPLLPGCYPDPSICRAGEDFYLVTSTFEYFPGLPVLHSRDLRTWRHIGHALDRPGMLDMEGIASSGGLYAPTIRFHDGVFWLVCTLVDQADDSRGGHFLLTATDPAGPWSDPVWLDADGIDPSLFFDDDGRVWVHGTRLAREPEWFHQTEVWLRELDPVTKQLVGPEHVLWTGAVRGAVWAEAPHLYKVDGTYYLVAAEGGTEVHHAVSVARATSVTGPYEGSKANPHLTHRHMGRTADVVGVGHADLVQHVDGSWWAVLLAMRPYGGYHYNLGRETFLVPVTWEDGWPLFAPGDGRVPEVVHVPEVADGGLPPGRDVRGARGVVAPDDPRWTTLRAPWDGFAAPSGEGWTLRLQPSTLAEATTPTFLGVRQQHRDVDARATLRVDGLAEGEQAGVVVRQSERDHATLSVVRAGEGFVVRAVHRRGGEAHVLGETAVEAADGARLTLTISARGQDYALVAQGSGEPVRVGVVDGRTLDTVATGGFLGLWFGVHATSEGRATTSVVELERFEYDPVG